MARVRIALIGVGDIATSGHLPALLTDRRVELRAVADTAPDRVEAARGMLPLDTARLTDPMALLADPAIDAVVLATPPWETIRLAELALAAGKYVLAEKPIAPTATAALGLGAMDPALLARLQIGFTYRHDPAIERLAQLTREGILRRPLLIRIGFFDEPADPVGRPEHFSRILRTLEHGPPIVHEGAHICDWLNLLLGEDPLNISAWSLRTDPNFATANMNGFAIGYSGGTVVSIEVAWLYPSDSYPRSYITLTGPDSHADLDPDSFTLRVRTPMYREVLTGHSDRVKRCFARQLDCFLTACLNDAQPVPGFAEAISSLEFTDRLVEQLPPLAN